MRPSAMRPALFALALLACGCASPCETLDAAQDDAAMQTCAFSASLTEDGTGSFSSADGAPVAFAFPQRAPTPEAFPDGSRLHGSAWVPAGEAPPAVADSARHVYTAAVDGDRYALGMMWTGEVRLHTPSRAEPTVLRVAEGEDAGAARLGIAGWPNRATHLAFAQDGAVLLGSDTQRTVTAWDTETGAERWSLTLPDDESTTGIVHLSPSPDGSRVAVATSRAVHVLSMDAGERVAQWAFPKTKTYVAQAEWTPDGQHVAVKKGGRWVPPSTSYSSTDGSGRRTSRPTMQRSEGYQNAPTVFLMRLPG